MLARSAHLAVARRSMSAVASRVVTDYGPYLSSVSARREPSAIRRLAPLLSRPGMVSLGGGMPNPDLFPFASMNFGVTDPTTVQEGGDGEGKELRIELSDDELRSALQYSPTPGLPALVKELRELQRREHAIDVPGDERSGRYDVTVTSGSQDGLTKAFEMLLDPTSDDELFVECPTYSGALAFLRPFGVEMTPVDSDGSGLVPESLSEALAESDARNDESGSRKKRKVLYVIPTAQNPSGSTLPNDRRERIYELASEHDMIVLEDDPYWFLHPERKSLKSFLSLDVDGRVMRFDSSSKLLSSGMRIGFVTGPKPLMERLNFHVQATNLHTSGLSQIATAKLLEAWKAEGFDQHARRVAKFYDGRRDVLVSAAERHLKRLASWTIPEAGMFLWIRLDDAIVDAKALIEEKAAAANVLFVPGQAFDPSDEPSRYVRASYSTATDDEMDKAMERLAMIVREEIEARGGKSSSTSDADEVA